MPHLITKCIYYYIVRGLTCQQFCKRFFTKILIAKIAAKTFRVKYIPQLIENQESTAMTKMLSLIKKMEPEEIDGYIDLSIEKGAVEITNRLIEYRQTIYTPEKNMQMMEEAFEKEMGIREKTLADYRKEFQIVKVNGSYVIKSCKGTNPTVIIPGNIKGIPVQIAEGAFRGTNHIQTVYIDDGFKHITDHAFEDCTNLQSIIIPDSVTSIGYKAFANCGDLTIHAPAGSYAEQYAKENNYKFQAL